MKKDNRVDEYISRFPEDVQTDLQKLRQVIQTTAPEAEETMSYGVPGYRLNGNLVNFAAFKNHIGFYPDPSAVEVFQEELKPYALSRGTIKFPFGEPIPYELVERIVRYRVNQVQGR
jgi:uncharacterized protein YdhG (YjbR/CyaY superfamily)